LAVSDRARQQPDDETLSVGLRLTPNQFREINRRAGIGAFDGRARSEYIVGSLFEEPSGELLRRVAEIRDADRAQFRAELEADRVRRAALRGDREDRFGSGTFGARGHFAIDRDR
jgi:hypothetical protein